MKYIKNGTGLFFPPTFWGMPTTLAFVAKKLERERDQPDFSFKPMKYKSVPLQTQHIVKSMFPSFYSKTKIHFIVNYLLPFFALIFYLFIK